MSKSKNSECVKVVVRCRPLNEKEIAANHERIVEMDVKAGQIRIKNPGSRGEDHRDFTFDSVYDWNSVQRDLYDETFSPLVEAVLNGFNGTIFAYGQTGTGKTYTMEGVRSDMDLKGVIPRSFDHIFDHISQSIDQQYLVRASYLEIYQEEIRDLLSKDQSKRLELKERPDTGVYVRDLLSFVTKSVKEIEHVMNVGNQNRSVGATNMNEHSSRSHAIFMITIECSELGQDEKNHIRVGKLNLVDLAGSERQSKTGSTGERLKEATKINLSLSALGNVISALVDGKGHIPYRDSKLTRLLQDSLGGNAKTVMVANIGPASYNYDESATTLRYANRAKNIKNKPKINEDPKDALLREFQEEIQRLKEQLGGGGKHGKRRRRHRNENGEMVSEDESDDEEVDEENLSAEQQEQLEQEKAKIFENQELEEEEKNKLLALKQEKIEEIKRAQTEKDNLNAKIMEMQSKLLVGGKTIIDHTKDQERQLATKRKEIAEQRRKEREMKQKLESKEESALEAQESYTSLRQEVDEKTKKLKKLFMKLQTTKSEIQKMEQENADEREELEQTQMQLARELKLKLLIIENFIPPDERKKIEERSYFDEDEGRYKIKPLNKRDMMKRPQSAHASNKRPKSQYARMAAAVDFTNPRYRSENILMVELDMPSRTTRDYEGPTVAPKVQAALDAALQEESDLHVDADANLFANLTKKKSKNRSKSARVNVGKRESKTEELYPTSRGLVPK